MRGCAWETGCWAPERGLAGPCSGVQGPGVPNGVVAGQWEAGAMALHFIKGRFEQDPIKAQSSGQRGLLWSLEGSSLEWGLLTPYSHPSASRTERPGGESTLLAGSTVTRRAGRSKDTASAFPVGVPSRPCCSSPPTRFHSRSPSVFR